MAALLRCGTNLTRVDEFWAEGLYRGTLAQALVTDAPLWPAHLPEIPHVPGSILMGVLAAPFYVLFGPTTFSMRLSGTLMHLAAVALFFWFVRRRFGDRAAAWCTWLFVLAPPGLARISVLSYGDHVESLPFILFAAIFALEWAAGAGTRLVAKAFLAGVGVSLAVGFHLQGTLGMGALAATCALLVPPRLATAAFWKELGAGFLPGLLLGALPALLVYDVTGCSSFSLWGSSPLDHMTAKAGGGGTPTDAPAKLLSLFRDGYSWTLQYEHRALADATLLLAAACAAGLLAVAARRWRAGALTARQLLLRGGFPVIYPVVFSAAYAVSSGSFRILEGTLNAVDVRYAMPVVPFLLLPIGLAAARLHESGRRAAALAVLLPALALGAYGSLSTCDARTIMEEPARRGFLWESFDAHLVWGALPAEDRERMEQVTAPIADRVARDAAAQTFVVSHADPTAWLAEVRAVDDTPAWTWPLRYRAPVGNPPMLGAPAYEHWLGTLPAGARPFALALAGIELGGAEAVPQATLRALVSVAEGEAERRAALRGFGDGVVTMRRNGRQTLLRFFDEKPVLARLAELPPDMDRAEVVFGTGFRVGRILHEWFAYGDPIVLRMLSGLPPGLRAAFSRGLGAGYRLRFLVPPPADLASPAVQRITAKLTPELERHFRAGLGGADTAR